VHHHKLETSTKLILAAIAVALVLQVFGPSLSVPNVLAELASNPTINLRLSGAFSCNGCGGY